MNRTIFMLLALNYVGLTTARSISDRRNVRSVQECIPIGGQCSTPLTCLGTCCSSCSEEIAQKWFCSECAGRPTGAPTPPPVMNSTQSSTSSRDEAEVEKTSLSFGSIVLGIVIGSLGSLILAVAAVFIWRRTHEFKSKLEGAREPSTTSSADYLSIHSRATLDSLKASTVYSETETAFSADRDARSPSTTSVSTFAVGDRKALDRKSSNASASSNLSGKVYGRRQVGNSFLDVINSMINNDEVKSETEEGNVRDARARSSASTRSITSSIFNARREVGQSFIDDLGSLARADHSQFAGKHSVAEERLYPSQVNLDDLPDEFSLSEFDASSESERIPYARKISIDSNRGHLKKSKKREEVEI